jgi:hypothetical protein
MRLRFGSVTLLSFLGAMPLGFISFELSRLIPKWDIALRGLFGAATDF